MSATFYASKLTGDCYDPIKGIESLNVSESNAASILANLGLSPDFYNDGCYPLEHFEAECATFLRIARGTQADAELPERVDGNFVTFARREGYLSDRISTLLNMAQAGLRNGATHLVVV